MTLKGLKIRLQYIKYRFFFTLIRNKRNKINVLSKRESIDIIIQKKYSVGRFGDGEFGMVIQYLNNDFSNRPTFQNFNINLAKRLQEILKEGNNELFVIGIPGVIFSQGTKKLDKWGRRYWQEYCVKNIPQLIKLLDLNTYNYIDSTFTRFYINEKNKQSCSIYVNKLKKIWENRNILIVEGAESRLGIGNDLFQNAKSIRRIICPSKNAWDKYDDILNETLKHVNEGDLILGALGMTATVLANDVAKKGFQCIDIGHVDIEYEWYLRNAKGKIQIPGKFTNEARLKEEIAVCKDEAYLSQIISTIE